MGIYSKTSVEEQIERTLSNLELHIRRYSRNRPSSYWRKARIAARLYLRGKKQKLSARDRRLIKWVLEDEGVTERLVDQAHAYLTATNKTNGRTKTTLEA